MIDDLKKYENMLSEAFTEYFPKHKSKITIFGFLLYVIATVSGSRVLCDDKLLLFQLSGIALVVASWIKSENKQKSPTPSEHEILTIFYRKGAGLWGIHYKKEDIISEIKGKGDANTIFNSLIKSGCLSKGIQGTYTLTEYGWNLLELDDEKN